MPDDNRSPMDAMMDIFMAETNGFLAKIEEILLESEKVEGGIRQATPEIFRIMHTIKSSSAMMSLDHISQLSHKVEDLFYFLRENQSAVADDAQLIDIVLESVDFIKRNLDGDEREDPAPIIEKIGVMLKALKSGASAKPEPAAPPAPQPAAQAEAPASAEAPAPAAPPAPEPVMPPIDRNKNLTVWLKRETQMAGLRSLEIVNRLKGLVDSLTSVPEDPSENSEAILENGLQLLIQTDKSTDELIAQIKKSPFVGRVAVAGEQPKRADDGASARQFVERRRDSASFGKAYANVEIAKLDNLVDLVSEILILQMELSHDLEQRDLDKTENAVSKLKKLILTLQEATLSTRMIPIRETFMKMNRLVRDMCRKLGIEVNFITMGEDTEVDRSIIEHISSPLMHIIRNSLDHGIEDTATRIQSDKPLVGRIELSAYTEGRNVVIAVTDDGRGLETSKILSKALDKGIITDVQAASMSEEDINSLIFLPGFTTNQEVTEYSGRGVGMDVVSDSLRTMNGRIIVHSQPGKGTKVVMKIPLTLAIIDTVIIRVGEETCAIPVSAVEKMVYMDERASIRKVNGEDVVLLEDECYRILNLFDFYDFSERIPYEDGVMIVIDGDTQRYVVFANEILDRQDVVVKPAPPLFKTIRGISGCTILGDGHISLILDTDELLASQTLKRSTP